MKGPRHKLPNWAVGLILIVVIAAASLLAYTKTLPWSHEYTIKAVFSTSQNIATNSPVRIAGVNVGKVTDVEHLTSDNSSDLTAATGTPSTTDPGGPTGQSEAVVTMEISDEGLPIHQDATLALRPRLFLEGNLFVDLHPGTPESPDAPDGYTIPLTQTSVSVQLDQVLSTLQSDVRSNLQVLLHSLGDAFIKYQGAEGLNEAYRTSPGAFKSTSLVNEAFLGTQSHDLSSLVRNLDSTVRALDANKSQLQGLIVNFERVTAATAAQDGNLARAVSLLPSTLDAARPAFAALNGAFPALRAFAREALPGVRTTPAALDASMPFLRQLRGLVSKPELRGLVHGLRPAIPDLARLSQRSVPFLNQGRLLSSCTNEVLTPFLESDLPDPDGDAANNGLSDAKVYPQGAFAAEGFGGISRTGDANGQPSRVIGASGPQILSFPAGGGVPPSFATSAFPVLGSRPALQSSAKTPFRPDAACEKQQPPNLSSGPAGPAPTQTTVSSAAPSPIAKSLQDASLTYLTKFAKAGGILNPEASGSAKTAKRPTRAQTAQARGLIAEGKKAWRTAIKDLRSGAGG
jgi:phospholipid/cholesterol/gamma-HCH transport system substrate-binding protein